MTKEEAVKILIEFKDWLERPTKFPICIELSDAIKLGIISLIKQIREETTEDND